VANVVANFDAKAMVIGLPINMDGSEGPAAAEARRRATHFKSYLGLPVFLQDERLTSVEATEKLTIEGKTFREIRDLIDSESAAIILRDFISDNARTT
jgi:putative Holliday junction resolvase